MIRQTARQFCEREIAPQHDAWEKAGVVPKSVWRKAGELGLLCMGMPQEYGGAALDFRATVVLLEELWRIGASGPGFALHSDIVAPYLLHHGSEAIRRTWLPLMARGEVIAAIAMTEPGTGSDLRAVSTGAVREGDEYVIRGAKMFITNGQSADVVLVVARTEAATGEAGLSLILVEADRPGFSRGHKLEKIGMKAQDTAELFFDGVRLPRESLLGEEGQGFRYLMSELAWERTLIAVQAMAVTERAIADTLAYTNQREVFGRMVADYQNTQFRLADFAMEAKVGRVFLDDCIVKAVTGTLDPVTAAMAKAWVTEMEGRVLDGCLQLHGGYGFIWDYPITRAFADARSQRIVGGTNEIMRQIIARSMPSIVDSYEL